MQIFHNLDDWRAVRKTFSHELSIGFVPTMGNLHIGHASLFKTSIKENDCTIASIFVNPTQFNQSADFTHYPRTLESDLDLLTKLDVDFCILPDEKSIYSDEYRYQIDENKYSNQMEGAHRPGHFKGVLTVVMKLLNLTQPHQAYFGEKDYMQLQLIKDMVDAFFMNINIKGCPTIREHSGLAYSSRNNRLSSTQKILADKFAQLFHQPISCDEIIKQLQDIGIKVDYIEEHQGRRFAAVNIDNIRLIDNYQYLTDVSRSRCDSAISKSISEKLV